MSAPKAIAFDVIETLFPLDPLRTRLAQVGLEEGDLDAFFAALLRDAFALDTCGIYAPFKQVASSVLGQMGVDEDGQAHLFEGFSQLDALPDVRPAFERMNDAGIPVICLTNGNPDVTDTLLQRNDLTDLVAHTISIDAVKVWKPQAKVYHYAAETAGVAPGDMALIACHAWDCQGALSAGCRAAYVDRGKPYGSAMQPVEVQSDDLVKVVEALLD
ncbi:2-haloalkanoic acid dehalogenase [Rhodobacteraceae bacterium THAF1]|uniref:HAD-IA family hydrolase n=1 Tax=Palleronia sp. THAF1 TaxID=2587842 RepID=UPI000F3E7B47|nr:HAD-IA family hydrolase [Palleronia sp. THAF1]QFU08512.1 2-haloalkanoic acid dehalogenase [Palleronia sp. THAF1]VDC28600.1 2-haloalkanoic acid dehalogenase [Rhodobacteraceae bacterium THAF1]